MVFKKLGKLASKGFFVLQSQYNVAHGESRDERKIMDSGRYSDYVAISSANSLRLHNSQWNAFADWVEDNYNLRTLKKINEKHVIEYLN